MFVKNMKVTPQLTKKRIDLGAQIPLSTPLVLYVEASSFCNLECTFCPHHLDPKNLNKANMEFSIFKKIIDDLQFFESDLQMLRMCGTGDPLFNKDLPSMLDYATAHRKFKKFELITNGLLINEAKNLEALTSNLSRLIISIEGLSDEDYQKFTNRNVRFLNFVKKLKKLYERRQGCKIHIKIHNSVVMEMQRRKLFLKFFLIFVMKFISKILLICGLKQTPPTSQRLNTVLMNKRLIRLQFAPKFSKLCKSTQTVR